MLPRSGVTSLSRLLARRGVLPLPGIWPLVGPLPHAAGLLPLLRRPRVLVVLGRPVTELALLFLLRRLLRLLLGDETDFQQLIAQ